MRTPRLTCVSEGNPLRRLLIGSKKGMFVKVAISHGAPRLSLKIQEVKNSECPRQESNLIYELRKLACESSTLQGQMTAGTALVTFSSSVARARGVEPRPPVLEAGCSPRSTLVDWPIAKSTSIRLHSDGKTQNRELRFARPKGFGQKDYAPFILGQR